VTGISAVFLRPKTCGAGKHGASRTCIRIGEYDAIFEWHQGMDSTKGFYCMGAV